jgi:hypothetical protein
MEEQDIEDDIKEEDGIEDDIAELCRLLRGLGSERMGERAAAARKVTAFLADLDLTWHQLLKARRTGQEEEHRREYNGFVAFSKSTESTYDEARGYLLLLATREEQPLLRQIMRKDCSLHQLNDEEHKLMNKLRDASRELRDMFVPEVFELKDGRKCRLVRSAP